MMIWDLNVAVLYGRFLSIEVVFITGLTVLPLEFINALYSNEKMSIQHNS